MLEVSYYFSTRCNLRCEDGGKNHEVHKENEEMHSPLQQLSICN